MIDNINKKPDLQFESLGLKGWHYFKEKLLAIKREYKLYGDIVLEKRLGECIDIYKDAFTKKNFVEAIRKIWEERYHYVANNLNELISFYEMAIENNIDWPYLLPETHKYNFGGETKGTDNTFAISMELYNFIFQECKKTGKKIYVLKNSNVYKVSLVEGIHDNTYFKICMKKISVIEVK